MSVFAKRGTVVAVMAALCLSATAMAQDLRTVGGPMRGSMALGNLQSTRAMGMGGASIAIEGPRSLNPAALGWIEEADVQITGMQADFNAGPETRYTIVEATLPVDLKILKGGIKLMGAAISSGSADNTLGLETHMWGREVGLEFGFGLTDRFSIGGAAFPSDPSEVRMKGLPFGTVTGRAQSQIGSIRLGSLMRVITEEDDLPGKLNVGAMYTHIIDDWETRGLPAGMDDDDTAYINVWSAAVAYEPCEHIALLFDYELGHIGGVDMGPASQNVDLIRFGTEVRPIDWIQLRAGSNDSRFTSGLGITCPRGWQIDYAYVDGGFEDAKPAFGHATVHSISLSKSF